MFLLETTGATAVAWSLWFGILLLLAGCYMVVNYILGPERMVSWLKSISKQDDLNWFGPMSTQKLRVVVELSTLIILSWFMDIGLLVVVLIVPLLLLVIRQMSLNLRDKSRPNTAAQVGVLVSVMLVMMLSITVLPVVKFHNYARDLAFNFVVNAHVTQSKVQHNIQQQSQAAWKAATSLGKEEELTAKECWHTDDLFDTTMQWSNKAQSLHCESDLRIKTWLCNMMSQLPIYSAQAEQIRPAYQIGLLPDQDLKLAREKFYQPVSDAWLDPFYAGLILLLVVLLAIFIWRWSSKLMGLQVTNLVKGASLVNPEPTARTHQLVYGMAERSKDIFQKLVGPDRLFQVDFRSVTVHTSVSELLSGGKDTHDVVVVDHFDELIKDPELVKLRVELLEFLLHKTDVSIFVVCSMDILSFLNQRLIVDQDLDSKLVARLAVALSYFSRQYYDEKPPKEAAADASHGMQLLHEECFHPNLRDVCDQVKQDPALDDYADQQIIDLVLARSRPIYQMMWDVCSHVEKFSLIQLAHKRPVNPNNWVVVQKLKQRGYLRRDPNYRIFNQSFEWFIQSVEPIEDMDAWHSEVTSTWDRIKMPVLVLLIFGLAFLAITQPGFFNSMFAWVAAAGAALPVALRLIGTWWASRAVNEAGSK